ncbi:MAG TPA: DUF4363 family protein [Firmicutes bacterium]|nr:DUF4363 family protein [Bacillota bacterium]
MSIILHFLLSKVIPALVLLLFMVIMNSGTVFKETFGLNRRIPENFVLLQVSIGNEEWSAADYYLKELKTEWKKLLPSLQFSVERDEINHFQQTLARMTGFIEAKEKAGTLAELRALEETWRDLGR